MASPKHRGQWNQLSSVHRTTILKQHFNFDRFFLLKDWLIHCASERMSERAVRSFLLGSSQTNLFCAPTTPTPTPTPNLSYTTRCLSACTLYVWAYFLQLQSPPEKEPRYHSWRAAMPTMTVQMSASMWEHVVVAVRSDPDPTSPRDTSFDMIYLWYGMCKPSPPHHPRHCSSRQRRPMRNSAHILEALHI